MIGYKKDIEKEKTLLEIGQKLKENNIAFNVVSNHYPRIRKYLVTIYIHDEYNTNEIRNLINKKYPSLSVKDGAFSIEGDVTIKEDISNII